MAESRVFLLSMGRSMTALEETNAMPNYLQPTKPYTIYDCKSWLQIGHVWPYMMSNITICYQVVNMVSDGVWCFHDILELI